MLATLILRMLVYWNTSRRKWKISPKSRRRYLQDLQLKGLYKELLEINKRKNTKVGKVTIRGAIPTVP